MTTKQRVEEILASVPLTRSSDKELQLIYMYQSGIHLTIEQRQAFREMPAIETITRVRRELQEQGRYQATEEVNEARYRKFQAVREMSRSGDVEQPLRLF